MTRTIDINCDVGEGVGNEVMLMPLISSCNIACGGHAGDETTMKHTIILALQNKVKIGAHPSYPDQENFGRKVLHMSTQELKAAITFQLNGFIQILNEEGGTIHHIKAHGALYNQMAKEERLAHIFLDILRDMKDIKEVPLYVPYNSAIQKVAIERDYPFYLEAFADRNYDENLALVPRSEENAIIGNPEVVLAHVVTMVKNGQVRTFKDSYVTIKADTFCVHSDTQSVLQILTYLHQQLPNHNIQLLK